MKKYCTQNNGDCQTCSLVNYGRDCRNNPVSETSAQRQDMIDNAIADIITDDLRRQGR